MKANKNRMKNQEFEYQSNDEKEEQIVTIRGSKKGTYDKVVSCLANISKVYGHPLFLLKQIKKDAHNPNMEAKEEDLIALEKNLLELLECAIRVETNKTWSEYKKYLVLSE
jgi:hypothetical protein